MMNFANVFDSGSLFGFGIGLGLFTLGSILFILIAFITIAIKGYALWHAAKRDDKGWFIALLLINTMGILDLIYLYFVVEKWKKPSESTSVPKQENKDQQNKPQ